MQCVSLCFWLVIKLVTVALLYGQLLGSFNDNKSMGPQRLEFIICMCTNMGRTISIFLGFILQFLLFYNHNHHFLVILLIDILYVKTRLNENTTGRPNKVSASMVRFYMDMGVNSVVSEPLLRHRIKEWGRGESS